MIQLEFYAKTKLTHSGELIVQSDKLSPAELQQRMLEDDPIWLNGRFRKAKERGPGFAELDYTFYFQ